MINHPPKGVAPNIVPVDFLWKDVVQQYLLSNSDNSNCTSTPKFNTHNKAHTHSQPVTPSEELYSIISTINSIGTGVWYVDPITFAPVPLSAQCTALAGIAMVATRDVAEGEELFLDYRFHPSEYPKWYSPV